MDDTATPVTPARPARRLRLRGRVVAAIAVASAVLVAAPAIGSFADAPAATGTLGTDALAPPSDLTAADGPCGADGTASVALHWTASTSTWADGYEVLMASTAGGPYSVAGSPAGAGTTDHTVHALEPQTTYHFAVRAARDGWRSASTPDVAWTTAACS